MSTDTLLQHPRTRAAAASPDVTAAAPGRRLAALSGELLLVLVPVSAAPLLGLAGVGPGWAWAAAALAALGTAAALIHDLSRTGQTPLRRLAGLRTVSTATRLPPGPSDLLRRRVVTADLRAGRDPLLIVPTPVGVPSRPAPVWRPPEVPATGTWRLELDGGDRFEVTRPTLIGRDPGDHAGEHALLAIPDLSRSISRVHALVEPGEDCLWLTDSGATNGTRAASPSASGGTVIDRWLRPGERAAVRAGGTIHLGDRALRVTRR